MKIVILAAAIILVAVVAIGQLTITKAPAEMIVGVERLSEVTFKLYDRYIGWIEYGVNLPIHLEPAMRGMEFLSMWDSLNVEAKRECLELLATSRPQRYNEGG